jgi:sulfite reductase (NADPH) flavoprotein alpha-component
MAVRRFAPRICNALYYDAESLPRERALLLVTGGRGSGLPPLDGEVLFERIVRRGGMTLSELRYSVAALGAPEVPTEPHAGRAFDAPLSAQGARRVYPRLDCDADFEVPFLVWTSGVLAALRMSFREDVSLAG